MYNFVIEKKNRLVGDNIDYEIHARVQSQQHRNCSIDWTHQFAVLDRVQDPQLDRFSSQKPVSKIQFAELLPDNDVMANLVSNWSVIVSQVITKKYLQSFHQLRDVVVRHIPHEDSKEMSQKSASLGSSLNLDWGVKKYHSVTRVTKVGIDIKNSSSNCIKWAHVCSPFLDDTTISERNQSKLCCIG